jgi:hypothetical protein
VALCRYRLVIRLVWALPDEITSEAVPAVDPDVAVIVPVPAATAVASPPLLTVTTAVLDDDHVIEVVRFCVLPSV